MRDEIREILFVVVLLELICLGSAHNDVGLIPNGKGILLAESVTQRIQASCIFSDDKHLLRHIAYVETADGNDPETYRDGYHGGMWKVEERYFRFIKSSRVDKLLLPYKKLIPNVFGIDWQTLTWKDCRKPLISALIARLYIEFKSHHVNMDIPRDIKSQAAFWKAYYRPNGDRAKFISMTSNLENAFKRAGGADIVFVIDGSGSISLSDFEKIKSFLKDVVKALKTEKYRFGLIQFSHIVRTEFDLNAYSTSEDIIRAIDNLQSMGESTETFLALERLSLSFSKENGGRGMGASKIAIVVTDGRSSNQTRTVAEAKKLHDAGIVIITIGVTNSVNKEELIAITSEPICLHLSYLSKFQEFQSLKYSIEQSALRAPLVLMTKTERTTIPADHSLNVQLKIPPGESTFIFHTESGIRSTIYLANKTFPSSLFYEKKLISTPKKNSILRVKNPSSDWRIMFANIASSNDTAVTTSIEIKHKDLPTLVPKRHGRPIKLTMAAGSTHFSKLSMPVEGVTLSLYTEPGKECTITLTEVTSKIPYELLESKPAKPVTSFVQGKSDDWFLYFNATGSQNETTTCVVKLEVGDKTLCPSKPCVNGYCSEEPYGFVCVCDKGYLGKRCDSVHDSKRFDCDYDNPCTLHNIQQGNIQFPHSNREKYVQCGGERQCFVKSCSPGTVWNAKLHVCVCKKQDPI